MTQPTDAASKELLAGLRAALDPDVERAGRKYTLLRRKLVSFFEWNGVADPAALADETLMSAAWKLTDGGPGQNVQASCITIARALLQKHTKPAADQPNPSDPPAVEESAAEPFGDLDRLADAFESALDALPDDHRELLLTYYAGNQPAHLDLRQAVAQRLGIPSNQLRLRATRTRKQLEESVMGDSTSGGTR